jgi:L-alanine-DL-glutamate epimerase-like enolase superfamily enzyme
MKIAFKPFELRLKQTFRIARSSSDTRNVVLIKIAETEEEFSKDFRHGLGEIIPYPYYGQTRELALELLPCIAKTLNNHSAPRDIMEVRSLAETIRAHLLESGHAPRTIKHVESAIGGALLDLCAKLRNEPLLNLIEKDLSEEERASLKFPLTSYTLGIDTPERMKEKTLEASEFRILKIKLGQSPEQDKENVKAVRSCTQSTLRVDANCGWNMQTAKEVCQWLETQDVEFIEQPMPPDRHGDYVELIKQTKIPIVLDESILDLEDIERNRDACHGVNIKFSKSGGFLPCLDMVRQARKCGLKVMLGSMIETSVGIGFAYHLSALVDWADLDGNVLTANDPYEKQGNLTIREGRITQVASRPGLGISDPHTCDWKTVQAPE